MNLSKINTNIIACRRCERLVTWREEMASKKTKRFTDWDYWGKAVPGFGDHDARLWIVGLAPAAHGANRTGRMFTGDRSGDWLYRALHRSGFANQAESTDRDDGLKLTNCYISSIAKCAPPANKLTPKEILNCRPYLIHEFDALTSVQVILCLGQLCLRSGS